MRHLRCLISLTLSMTCGVIAVSGAHAADPWDPFGQQELQAKPQRKKPATPPVEAMRPDDPSSDDVAPPPRETVSPAWGKKEVSGEKNGGVEKGDLAPIIASDGSGLPLGLWKGLDSEGVAGLIGKLSIPPKSPAIAQLWRRLITAEELPGGAGDAKFAMLRADALYRSGLLEDASKALGREPATTPLTAALAARIELGLGRSAKGCELVKGFIVKKAELPKKLQGDALLMTGICAAVAGNPSGAGLAAEFAREDKTLAGPDDAASLLALDAIAGGQKNATKGLKTLSLLQYRAFELGGGVDPRDVAAHGDTALFAAIGADAKALPVIQLGAAESAVRANAMTPDALADLYRGLGATSAPEALLGAGGSKADASLHRAALFKAAEAERTPLKKVRVMRALLDDAKRAGLYLQTLEMLAKTADEVQPVPEIGWFAETGIEIGLASGHLDRARQWSNLGGSTPGDGGLRHWQALIDISDPALKTDRGQSLGSVEALASRGRLSPDLLHRLATVLDANDTNVPLALWDQANRAPQPPGGYLPETGVLTSLQDASKKKEFGRTVLLVMTALGPNGAEGAHLISLGDSIRALRRAGLEADARRLSFEALFALWPRSASN
jgi:hypothetical protein